MSETLLIAKNRDLYFFPYCTEIDVWSRTELLDAMANPLLSANQALWSEKLSHYQLIIFLDYGFSPEMAAFVKRYTAAKVVLYFWNYFAADKQLLLAQTQAAKVVDEIFSFDPIEAQQYGLLHNSTFYSLNLKNKTLPIQYDIFFGASNKGRVDQALELEKTFELLGLTTFYHITKGEGKTTSEYVPYDQYLDFVFQSRAILEIMREHQTGLTLRSMEALYFQKKLITTNPVIKDYCFYHPHNIFVLGQDDNAYLPEFMQKPYEPVEKEILDFYDVSAWARRFVQQDLAAFQRLEYKNFQNIE